MKSWSVLELLALTLWPLHAEVVTCPAPADEPLSSEYEIHIGTNQVAVYAARVLDPPFAGKTVVPRTSRHLVVRGVKICGSRVQNDDGINPCNSQDVLMTDCFIRTDDDCIALKGLELSASN